MLGRGVKGNPEAFDCNLQPEPFKMGLRGKNGSPKIFETIGFSMGEKAAEIRTGSELDIVFSLQEDEWNGNKKIQLNLIDFKIISE